MKTDTSKNIFGLEIPKDVYFKCGYHGISRGIKHEWYVNEKVALEIAQSPQL